MDSLLTLVSVEVVFFGPFVKLRSVLSRICMFGNFVYFLDRRDGEFQLRSCSSGVLGFFWPTPEFSLKCGAERREIFLLLGHNAFKCVRY